MKTLARRQLTFENRIILAPTDDLEGQYIAIRQRLTLQIQSIIIAINFGTGYLKIGCGCIRTHRYQPLLHFLKVVEVTQFCGYPLDSLDVSDHGYGSVNVLDCVYFN